MCEEKIKVDETKIEDKVNYENEMVIKKETLIKEINVKKYQEISIVKDDVFSQK